MHPDVLDLRNFYYRTQLGRAAQKALRNALLTLWPPRAGETVAGFGFAVPLLRPWVNRAGRVIALMPGQQGVMPWPVGMPNVSVLSEEASWPLASDSVDRLVLMHGLETSDTPSAVLQECARVLRPEGRVMVIVPNRAGLWSRADSTPFGQGRPYSARQVETQLKAHDLVPERVQSALYLPPSEGAFWLRTAPAWERYGRYWPWRSGGVLMVEASRQVWSPRKGGLGAVMRAPLRVLEGAGRPLPVPGAGRKPQLNSTEPTSDPSRGV